MTIINSRYISYLSKYLSKAHIVKLFDMNADRITQLFPRFLLCFLGKINQNPNSFLI